MKIRCERGVQKYLCEKSTNVDNNSDDNDEVDHCLVKGSKESTFASHGREC